MTERDPVRLRRAVRCLDPLDVPAQRRKRAHACAGHGAASFDPLPILIF
jgi:hypothetical protein